MKIKRIAALLLAATAVFSLTACKKGWQKGAGQKISYNLTGDPATLDPQIASDTPSLIVIQAVYEGLTRLGGNGKVQPGVAEKWESNADHTQFTFHLRANAKWSDKQYGSVTAKDFVYAFRRALNPKTGSTTCSQMFCIKNAREVQSGSLSPESLGVVAKDSKTLAVTLESSCPDFPKIAASAVYMPCNQKFFEKTAGRYGLETTYLLSDGPFDINTYDWNHGKTLKLTHSSTYTGSPSPLPSEIDFTIGSKTDGAAALKSGTVDAAPVSVSQVSTLKGIGCTLVSFQNTVWGLCFNTQSDIFKNEKMRDAFLQSFSRSNVLSHLPEGTTEAKSIFLPGTTLNGSAFHPSGGPFYLKQDSGAPQTFAAGLQELHLKSLSSLTVLCPNDTNVELMVNEMIAAWNKQFNNYFNLKSLSESDLLSRINSGDYDFAVCPLKPDDGSPATLLSLFMSGAAGNPAHLNDSAYDALVSDAQSKGGAAGIAAYTAAATYLSKKAIFYPLYYENNYYASAKGVTGIVFYPFHGIVDFRDAGKR